MKLKIALCFTLIPAFVFAQSPFETTMDMPQSYIQDFNPEAPKTVPSQQPAKSPVQIVKSQPTSLKIKIAILVPSKQIGRYATSTTNALFAYMMTKNRPFEMKTFEIDNQESDTLSNVVRTIESQGFNYVIAPLTKDGVEKLNSINPQINIFIPTINKEEFSSTASHLYFGGIDYKAQIDALVKLAHKPLVIFKDNSLVSENLSQYAQKKAPVKSFAFTLNKSLNLKKYLYRSSQLQHASFMTNTPVVKTGVLLSQINLYDVEPTNALSTQINYDPILLSMTQYNDRKSMIIANSISRESSKVTDANLILNNDIVYDWINYATTIGADYFYNRMTGEAREYPLTISANQILYPINLVRPSTASFVSYK
jgi:SRSO17 transposase